MDLKALESLFKRMGDRDEGNEVALVVMYDEDTRAYTAGIVPKESCKAGTTLLDSAGEMFLCTEQGSITEALNELNHLEASGYQKYLAEDAAARYHHSESGPRE